MGRTGRLALLVVVGLSLAVAGVAAAVAALPFEAQVVPIEPLKVAGAVQMGRSSASTLASWRPSHASQAQLGGSTYTLNLLEAKWSVGPGSADLTPQPTLRGDHKIAYSVVSTQIEMNEPRLEILDLRAEAKWVLQTGSDARSVVGLGGQATCDLARGEPSSFNLSDAPDALFPSHVAAPRTTPVLVGTCASTRLTATGPATLNVFGTKVRITSVDSAAQTQVVREVETGLFWATSASVRAGRDYRFVSAAITTATGSEAFAFRILPSIHVQTPWTQVQGALAVPPAAGNVQWGAKKISSPSETLRPEGTFVLAPGSQGTLEIRGHAGNSWEKLAVGAGAVATVGAALRYGPGMFHALFTRVRQDRALDHPRRREIADLVAANPGIHTAKAARILGVSERILQYHADVLHRQGLLLRRKYGHTTALFLPGQTRADRQEILHRVSRPALRRVLALLQTPSVMSLVICRNRFQQ